MKMKTEFNIHFDLHFRNILNNNHIAVMAGGNIPIRNENS